MSKGRSIPGQVLDATVWAVGSVASKGWEALKGGAQWLGGLVTPSSASNETKSVVGYLVTVAGAVAVAVGTGIGIVGFFTPSSLTQPEVEATYYDTAADTDPIHPMVGKWVSSGEEDPFVIVVLPQSENNPDGDKFEGHSERRVWKGWQEGESLQLYYLPRAEEMNPDIPRAARERVDGELEWRLDLTRIDGDPYDRRVKAVWWRGEVEWDEGGGNGRVIGDGEPLEFELVYDPILFVSQDGPITITVESASDPGDGEGPPPVSAVVQDQRVFISVFMPYREFEQVGPSLTVDIRGTESGARQSLTLRPATADLFGAPVRYTHQFAVSLGECGGDRMRYKPPALSLRWLLDLEGDGDCLDFTGAQKGEIVEVTYRDAAFRFSWYPTWVQAALSTQMEEVARLKILLEGFQATDGTAAAREHTQRKLQMIENYVTLMRAEFLTDLHRIAIGEVYLGGTMAPAAFRIPRDLSVALPNGGLLHYTDDDFRRLASSTARLTTDSESTVWGDVLAFYGGADIGRMAAEGIRAMTDVRWTPIFTGRPDLLRPEENETLDVRSDEKTLVYAAVRATSSRLIDEVARNYYEGVTFALYDGLANSAPFVVNLHTLATGKDHFGRKVDNLELWLSAVGLGSEIILTNAAFIDIAGHAAGRVGKRMADTHLLAHEARQARPLPIRV